MSIIRTITKNVITRAWHDIEPKLLAFLATGLTATALIAAADYVGIHLPDGLASLIVLIVGGIAGYIKSSTSTVIDAGTAGNVPSVITTVADPVASAAVGE
jgi:hypothetical protein